LRRLPGLILTLPQFRSCSLAVLVAPEDTSNGFVRDLELEWVSRRTAWPTCRAFNTQPEDVETRTLAAMRAIAENGTDAEQVRRTWRGSAGALLHAVPRLDSFDPMAAVVWRPRSPVASHACCADDSKTRPRLPHFGRASGRTAASTFVPRRSAPPSSGSPATERHRALQSSRSSTPSRSRPSWRS
jgi:hypothetical protein